MDFLSFDGEEYNFFLILMKKRISYDIEKIAPNMTAQKTIGYPGFSFANTYMLTTEISIRHSMTNFKNFDLTSCPKKLKERELNMKL